MPSSTASVLAQPAAQAETRWEKADTVLWAFTPDGIVLHNFACSRYLNLDAAAHIVWSYLDGLHAPEEIAEKLGETPAYAQAPRVRRLRQVRQVIAELVDGGFIKGVP